MSLRLLRQLAGLLLGSSLAFAQQETPAPAPPAPPPVLCAGAYHPECGASAQDQKNARKLFDQAIKLKREGRADEAFSLFKDAADLVPRNVEYETALAIARQQLVLQNIRHGDDALAGGNEIVAMASYRSALEADPANLTAADRLREAARQSASPLAASAPALKAKSPPQIIDVVPRQETHSFHLRTDSRSLFVQIAQAFGINAHVDDQITPRAVRFDLDNADFALAIETAQLMANAFWVPVSEHDILVEPNTPQARQQYERVALQTFYFENVSTPQDLNEILNMLRGVFEARQLAPVTSGSTITLRGPVAMLREAEQVIDELQQGRPQVLIDVTVYQVSRSALHDIGVTLPLQFQMFNLSNIQQLLGGQNLQSILSSVGASGSVNGQSVSAILAQLAQQNPQLAALLANPIATFGGGRTFFGVGIPPATLKLSLNTSNIKQLDHLTLHVQHGSEGTFRFGERYPVLTANYSAVYNLPGLSQLTGGNRNLAAFPAVNYQDLGLSLKTTPTIHGSGDITLKLDIQIQALGGSSVNSVPVIDNRQYQGTINLMNGETAVVAGMVSEQDVRNIQGLPVLSQVPVAGAAVSDRNHTVNEDELLITITPHIIRESLHKSQTVVMTP